MKQVYIILILMPVLALYTHGYSIFEYRVEEKSYFMKERVVELLTSKLDDHFKKRHRLNWQKLDGETLLLVTTKDEPDDYKNSYYKYLGFLKQSLKDSEFRGMLILYDNLENNPVLGYQVEDMNKGKRLGIYIKQSLEPNQYENLKNKIQSAYGGSVTVDAVRYEGFSFFSIEPIEDFGKAAKELTFLKVINYDASKHEVTATIQSK